MGVTSGVGVLVTLGIAVLVAVRGRGVFVMVGVIRVAVGVLVTPVGVPTIAPGTLTCGAGTFMNVLSLITTFAPEIIPPTSP